MPANARRMRLTPEIVAKVALLERDPGPLPADLVPATQDYHDAAIGEVLAGAPASGDIWIFAYGSLIWKPAHVTAEERIALAHGWHRSFCLGWLTRYRGSDERPALMMALDRGGECKGVAHRLPADAVEENLRSLFRREMPYMTRALPARWISLRTAAGPLRAIAFVIDREAGRYVSGLSLDQIAGALATAAGEVGSMADYLYMTVKHLEEYGIHDRHLWRLQELVAEKIETANGRSSARPSG